MATLSELRTRIKNKVQDGRIVDLTDAQIDDQINLSIDFYEREKFWFLEGTATLTSVIDDPVLSTGFPTDFKEFNEPNALVLVDNSTPYPMTKVSSRFFDSIDYNGSGFPRYYTYRNGQLEIYAYPDQAYTFTLNYRIDLPDLASDGDSNVMTINAERLIEYKTLEDILRDYRSDFNRSAVYEAKVEKELRNVRKETYNRTATGELTTENIISNRGYRNNYYY